MADVPELKTRKPTGKPPWPLVVLAGVEKSGKSWSAAEFSASDLIDRTFWCEIGEGAADQYGILPGARYEILEHDGSYVGIGRALRAATLAPRNGRPHAIVVDAVSTLWDMLSDEAQAAANNREKRKHPDRPLTGDVQITMDLWNIAKARWNRIINMLRVYDGPVILIARLETVAVVEKGKPTESKALKIKGEKNLSYEADAIVRIPSPREYEITGVRSVFWQMEPGGVMPAPEFTLDWLMRKLGLAAEGATAPRSYTAPAPDGADFEREVDRPMERSKPKQPQPDQDPWATPTSAASAPSAVTPAEQPAANPAEAPKANAALLKAVNTEVGKRVGSNREDRLGLIADIIGRPITSSSELTVDEAKAVLAALTRADEQNAAPAGSDGPPQGWTAEMADQLAADFLAALQATTNDAARVEIAGQIAKAVKARKISSDDRDTLLAAYNGGSRQPAGVA
ncbi:MAG TPA: AAA family ATPase [Actinocrinis sp.]|uniref:AAA family ATPase n=1 Tax=Actinocrinis sp. TaxID=1920516 RepID=UPI002DDD1947|nr:AAA family ATPase [Actinocrinis sp.]HEV2342999.1 AAA family ATPase [Actinocrinis sp.]